MHNFGKTKKAKATEITLPSTVPIFYRPLPAGSAAWANWLAVFAETSAKQVALLTL